MANLKNLKPIRTKSEAREKGIKGGLKSGKIRRERKALKEELICILSEGDTQSKMSTALIDKALNGDVRAFETVRDTIGEKPTDKMEIKENEDDKLQEITIFEQDIYDSPQKVIEKLSQSEDYIKVMFITNKHRDEVIADIEKLTRED